MLSGYNDCHRRAIAHQFGTEIRSVGFELNTTKSSVGASLGTATHKVIERFFNSFINSENFNQQSAVDDAISEFKENTKEGVIWDDATPNIDVLVMQTNRMATAYIETIGKTVKPVATEVSLKADINETWLLSGHVDLICKNADSEVDNIHVRDLKTGKLSRSHHNQLGAYSLLVKHNNYSDVKVAAIDFLKRCPKTKPQELPVTTKYKVSVCEGSAWFTIQHIIENDEKFIKNLNPLHIPDNSMSMMCSEKYCCAYGTDFCSTTKYKEVVKEEK